MYQEGYVYRVIEPYNVFLCNIGWIRVGVGAHFEIKDGKVRFIGSKNYLPMEAVRHFLKNVKAKIKT